MKLKYVELKQIKSRAVLAAALLLAACSGPDAYTEVAPTANEVILELQVKTSADDAEQSPKGSMNLRSSRLELTRKSSADQLVGLRFSDLQIPQGTVITEAHVAFRAARRETEATSLTLRAEAGNAQLFGNAGGNLSRRPLTKAAAQWQVPAWAKGTTQRTPDLSTVIQEVVNQPSWQPGNALALLISGSGRRTAESFDGDAEGAPLLHLSYRTSGTSTAPIQPPLPASPTPAIPAPAPVTSARVAAFPSAEGFGSSTVAGRGGRVMFVTNLNDSGSGSLRAAVEASGPRTVLFKVGGTITLKSRLHLTEPFITIAGQSAPGDGILLRGAGNDEPIITVQTHDVLIRYLRFRKGPGGGQDNVSINGSASSVYNVVFDHNSFSWSTDENINTYRDVHDVTFSWNIIAEPLHCSTHSKGCHGKNGSMGKYSTGSQSFHHNLIMSSHDRSLKLNQSYGVTDYINNVHYNNYDTTNLSGEYIGKTATVGINLIGNLWLTGSDSYQGKYLPQVSVDKADNSLKVYAKDNIGTANIEAAYQSATAFSSSVRPTAATIAYEQVLIGAGATLPRRDAVDLRLVAEVKARTGQWVDDPAEVGGWPTLRSATPASDRDNDGMADAWEQAHGLNPNTPDNAADQDGDGYTNLEAYLAWLTR